jgi:hypothetical protein
MTLIAKLLVFLWLMVLLSNLASSKLLGLPNFLPLSLITFKDDFVRGLQRLKAINSHIWIICVIHCKKPNNQESLFW